MKPLHRKIYSDVFLEDLKLTMLQCYVKLAMSKKADCIERNPGNKKII